MKNYKFVSFLTIIFSLTLLGAGCNKSDKFSAPSTNPPSEIIIPTTTPSVTQPTSPPPGSEQSAVGADSLDPNLPGGSGPSAPPPTLNIEPVVPVIKEFKVTAKQWEFIPATITVNEGDTVRLIVTSTDVDHGLAISDFGVNEIIKAGSTKTVEFVADKKGTYTIFCSVFCGSGHGTMKGTLLVQ